MKSQKNTKKRTAIRKPRPLVLHGQKVAAFYCYWVGIEEAISFSGGVYNSKEARKIAKKLIEMADYLEKK